VTGTGEITDFVCLFVGIPPQIAKHLDLRIAQYSMGEIPYRRYMRFLIVPVLESGYSSVYIILVSGG
jgi:hypothetical protein